MYKCNKCGAFFERPEEKEIESENYARPFGDGSEPFGGGYYECCPECGCEGFDRYEEEEPEEDKCVVIDTFKKITIEKPENQITFMKKPQDIKVMIWGYELCKGAEWKDFLDVVNKLGKEISDLEAKLAESEKQVKGFVELFDKKQHENYEQFCEIIQLKQQLAEKEKAYQELLNSIKIKDLSNINFIQVNEDIVRFSEGGVLYEYNKKENTICKIIDQAHQDKISFAVEHINQFKDFILNNIYLTNNGDEEKVNKFANKIIENIKGE